MSKQFTLAESLSTNPYFNLAAETLMTDNADNAVFFLWQNAPTVVIGYNQNPYSECNLERIKTDNIFLARRRTGGGAVFHDQGNLNFSFCMPTDMYDVHRQSKVIVEALKKFGINAEISGRNDILYNGKKFSGNAYYNGKNRKLHHGTLMVDVDFNSLSNYLTPDPLKYIKKGVASVRSRVINLSQINQNITIDDLKKALFSAFSSEYGLSEYVEVKKIAEDDETINGLAKEISSDEYLYKKWRDFSQNLSSEFSWGVVKASVSSKEGKVVKVIFATDGLYPEAVIFAERYFSAANIKEGLKTSDFPDYFSESERIVATDLIELIKKEHL